MAKLSRYQQYFTKFFLLKKVQLFKNIGRYDYVDF